jgi:hypothetical protein
LHGSGSGSRAWNDTRRATREVHRTQGGCDKLIKTISVYLE